MVSEGQVREFLLPEPEFVRLEDARVATYRLGRSHGGPVVVFCHGTPWSARVWRDVADAVAADQAVLLWDMPGYGRSEQGPHLQLDLATQMARFAALLRQFEIDRPQVIAHDIGGAVSLGAHLLHGVDYTALQLWDVVTLDPWGSPFFRLVADHAEVFGALPPALHEALVREYIRGAACLPLTDDDLADLVAPWLGEQGQPGFYQQIAALRAEHTRPLVHRLAQVRCPVAIGWGEADPWIPVEQAERLRQGLPGDPSMTVIPTAGHLVPLEQPGEATAAVRDWLQVSTRD